ncbi:MAG TPA: response regulator [Phycisphaerales bacterium]|nr:response regulator [Phycisphaerales bacterium]
MNPTASSANTILVCDDETAIRSIVADKLRRAGYTVVEARSGFEGLCACDHAALKPGMKPPTPTPVVPSLIVTDLQMPVMSGLEMALALKAFGPTSSTPVIMLTARGYIADQNQVAQTNIRQMMAKPFSASELLDRVRAMLQEPLRQAA